MRPAKLATLDPQVAFEAITDDHFAGRRPQHGFGDFGPAIENRSPWMHWLQLSEGGGMPPLEDWSMSSAMARANRFVPPQGQGWTPANAYSHAYHFDAGLFAAHLREHAERAGVQRVEGTIVGVDRRADNGFVEAVRLEIGRASCRERV